RDRGSLRGGKGRPGPSGAGNGQPDGAPPQIDGNSMGNESGVPGDGQQYSGGGSGAGRRRRRRSRGRRGGDGPRQDGGTPQPVLDIAPGEMTAVSGVLY